MSVEDNRIQEFLDELTLLTWRHGYTFGVDSLDYGCEGSGCFLGLDGIDEDVKDGCYVRDEKGEICWETADLWQRNIEAAESDIARMKDHIESEPELTQLHKFYKGPIADHEKKIKFYRERVDHINAKVEWLKMRLRY